MFDGDGGRDGLPEFTFAYRSPEPDIIDDPSDYADDAASLEHARTWEWMHPLAEVQGALRAAGLTIDAFEEHDRVPWRIFPATVPLGEGMFGWPAEQWLPLSYELVASAPLR